MRFLVIYTGLSSRTLSKYTPPAGRLPGDEPRDSSDIATSELCGNARAITPPFRNRRFDARFFMIDAEHTQGEVHERPQGSGELLDLHWVELFRTQHMEGIPHITRVVLQELKRRLKEDADPEECGPFMYTRHGKPVIEQI